VRGVLASLFGRPPRCAAGRLVANATFLGASTFLGRAVVGWTKADFIDYYADAETCEPVSWYFHSMKARFDTLAWVPGRTVPDASYFEPPAYCAPY
jgi:hypothetical protein